MKKLSKRKQNIDNTSMLYKELNLIYKELLDIKGKIELLETKLDIKNILDNNVDKKSKDDTIDIADNHKPSGSRSQ